MHLSKARSTTVDPDERPHPAPVLFDYDVPLDPRSPWPKLKRDSAQTGRSTIKPSPTGQRPWRFRTELGVFSSAVIDADENIYIGSGDHAFYCFTRTGEVKWRFVTGEIIDATALLDDRGRIYLSSGDGWIYALDRTNGELIWKTECHRIADCHARNVNSLVDWFEGHVAITADGTLLVPNDNFHTYAVDRDDGRIRWYFLTDDQTWSLPAYNRRTNTLFMGTNYFTWRNVFAYSAIDGRRVWSKGTLGSMVASPLLTSPAPDGLVIVAGFDGLVRALRQRDGRQVWSFTARDHLYASPVQAQDGTIIQASTDGCVYALNPRHGRLRWTFETPEPVRATPAIDGDGNIYFGNGEGKLYCVASNGAFRWSYRCIEDERSDLNGSPALSREAVVAGGDDGTITRIPLDYPTSETGRADPRCQRRPTLAGPRHQARLYLVSRYGKRMNTPPETIPAHGALTLSLVVHRNGRRIDAMITPSSVRVQIEGAMRDAPNRPTWVEPKVSVSADHQFLTIIPSVPWTGPAGGQIVIRVTGRFCAHPWRLGLRRFGGWRGGSFEESFKVRISPRATVRFPFVIAGDAGRPCSTLEIGRLCGALPTILSSYNQLGFDSIHYHLGFIEGDEQRALLWGVGAKLVGAGSKRSIVDPSLPIRFAMHLAFDRGLLTLTSVEGFTLEFNGWDIPYDLFRLTTEVEPADQTPQLPVELSPASLNAVVRCDEIAYYGPFLKLLGVSDLWSGKMHVSGAVGRVRHLGVKTFQPPGDAIDATVAQIGDVLRARIDGARAGLNANAHNYGLLLVRQCDGQPLPLKYTKATRVEADAFGALRTVQVQLSRKKDPGGYRAYLMVDTCPVFRTTVNLI